MQASIQHHFEREQLLVWPVGGWVIEEGRQLDRSLEQLIAKFDTERPRQLVINLSEVEALDTAGAFLLARIERHFAEAGVEVAWTGVGSTRAALLERIRDVLAADQRSAVRHKRSLLEDIGETVLSVVEDGRHLLDILGGTVREMGRILLKPSTFRGPAVARQIEMTGVRAVPIIVLMSFLIGGIIAQQGAFQLRFFGATLFTVDLVGILVLREIAPLLTAIMVAGRSGSAITAELGSMRMREEIDALRVMGLEPINVLVVPRVLALIIVLPLLSFLAGLAALLGAMLTLWLYVDIMPVSFIQRLQDSVDFSTLFSGLFKAPFMALTIALIACTEGMSVRGSAESLGAHTTASVVKSIFMVIVVDGIFAIFYGAIDF